MLIILESKMYYIEAYESKFKENQVGAIPKFCIIARLAMLILEISRWPKQRSDKLFEK